MTSKRKLLRLVNENRVSGWDDPRLLTLCGLRRRGVRPQGIKKFCDAIGVTVGQSLHPMSLFEEMVREDLDPVCPRRMVVLDPLLVDIVDYAAAEECGPVSNHPSDKSLGSRTLKFTKALYIDRDDLNEAGGADYYRFSKVGDEVKLKGAYVLKLQEIIRDASGMVISLKCTHDKSTKDGMPTDRKVRGVVHWVDAKSAVDAEVRVIHNLFLPDDGSKGEDMMAYVNPDSMVRFGNAKCEAVMREEVIGEDSSVKNLVRYQFERKGFFTADRDSSAKTLVFNRTVPLKESSAVKNMVGGNQDSRKAEQEKQKAEKERLMKVKPEEYFKTEFKGTYTKFDERGVPTHGIDGEEISKSGRKKLEKDFEKQKKLHEGWLKTNK